MSYFDLPADIRNIELIKHLSVPTFLRLASSNRSLHSISRRPEIWISFLRRDFPEYPGVREYQGPYGRLIYYYFLSGGVELSKITDIHPKLLGFLSTLPESSCIYFQPPTFAYSLRSSTALEITQTGLGRQAGLDNFEIKFDYNNPFAGRPSSQLIINISDLEDIPTLLLRYLRFPSELIIRDPAAIQGIVGPIVDRFKLKSRSYRDSRYHIEWTNPKSETRIEFITRI